MSNETDGEHDARGAVRAPIAPVLVLFDRDGTLVVDVPYNGDPGAVDVVPGAVDSLGVLRAAGVRIGLVTNQSGVARGLIGPLDVRAVNERLADLVGGFDTVQVCVHGSHARCRCRKPEPGMILAAARELDVPLERCALVGDIGSDVTAGQAAGVRSILVPTAATRPDEVVAAPEVAADLLEAVEALLRCTPLPSGRDRRAVPPGDVGTATARTTTAAVPERVGHR